MSRKFTDSFEFSARCMAGNGLGAIPLHHISSDRSSRMHSSRDVAGIATAGLAGNGSLASIEAAFRAAARDGNATTARRVAPRAGPRMSRLAALLMKAVPRRPGPGWLQALRAAAAVPIASGEDGLRVRVGVGFDVAR